MTYELITVLCGGPGPDLPHCGDGFRPFVTRLDNTANLLTPAQCYQLAYTDAHRLPALVPEVLILMHDDIAVYDPDWLPKVLDLFSNPLCVVAGLGGASSLGRESLYKRPYRISDMSRGGYVSAQRDWITHGGHLSGSRRVAVVDAFFIAVRISFLDLVGGWPVDHLSHHCIDLWVCCEAARQGKEVWATGIDCHHFGGKSSTNKIYREAAWLQGKSLVSDHEIPHKWLHSAYSDVLPIRIKECQ